eukprot:gnl/MRDRNA2_/MRDRNA2_177047_c0_seq1.p1 gnl/MRDRNA2_/MRDRNA2_177047_c0~~gnl/MRDRNA2_/MRDRNA2_177047_c0_seq1.p1  ORF type:complete len:104 (+),score=17.61 gnl/MRDRNA2_/MRDRNA2_177047_c0_seq1:231-542(+)
MKVTRGRVHKLSLEHPFLRDMTYHVRTTDGRMMKMKVDDIESVESSTFALGQRASVQLNGQRRIGVIFEGKPEADGLWHWCLADIDQGSNMGCFVETALLASE